jgi:predicted nucleic acid-binding protein
MKNNKLRIYWDSSVWIAWNRNDHNIRSLCSELIKDTIAGKIELVISPLVIAEFAGFFKRRQDLCLPRTQEGCLCVYAQ